MLLTEVVNIGRKVKNQIKNEWFTLDVVEKFARNTGVCSEKK